MDPCPFTDNPKYFVVRSSVSTRCQRYWYIPLSLGNMICWYPYPLLGVGQNCSSWSLHPVPAELGSSMCTCDGGVSAASNAGWNVGHQKLNIVLDLLEDWPPDWGSLHCTSITIPRSTVDIIWPSWLELTPGPFFLDYMYMYLFDSAICVCLTLYVHVLCSMFKKYIFSGRGKVLHPYKCTC